MRRQRGSLGKEDNISSFSSLTLSSAECSTWPTCDGIQKLSRLKIHLKSESSPINKAANGFIRESLVESSARVQELASRVEKILESAKFLRVQKIFSCNFLL